MARFPLTERNSGKIKMLELRNKTPFETKIAPAMDKELNEYLVIVVKATYDIINNSHELALSEEQIPIILADEYYAEPDTSSIETAADSAMIKIGTDITLKGKAYDILGGPYVDTFLKVGPVSKVIRVFGNRHWEKLYGGWKISPPARFESMPMTFENAYGGFTLQEDADLAKYESRNPIGKGFYEKKDDRQLEGFELPNLENPHELIGNWRDRPNPSCYAPVAPHWMPRSKLAGTYDEAWEKNTMPYLPQDFNEEYFNVAPKDLISRTQLKGGEVVEYENLSKIQRVRFNLPQVNFRIRYSKKEKTNTGPNLIMDTINIDTEAQRLSITWRARLPSTKELLYFDWITVKLS